MGFENYEDDEFPPLKGVIRADTIISGYIIRGINEQETTITIIS